MSKRKKILEFIAKRGSANGPELADHLGVTRQAVNLHLRQLIARGMTYLFPIVGF